MDQKKPKNPVFMRAARVLQGRLLKRLDKAIALAYEDGQFIDEVNDGTD